MDKTILIERALKAIVNWNSQSLLFDEDYLKLQDNCELVARQEENGIRITTVFPGGEVK